MRMHPALDSWISWLMGQPAGLKLNRPLARFLGELYLWLLEVWMALLYQLSPVLRRAVPMGLVILGSGLGLTAMLAGLADLVALLTLHLSFFHFVSTRLFGWEMRALLSLFHLFRGKRFNRLRERVDSAPYSTDEVLLGTVILAFFVFILPTVTVYFALFACAHFFLNHLPRMALELLTAALDHLPIYQLFLCTLRPDQIPSQYLWLVSEETTGPNNFCQLTTVPTDCGTVLDDFYSQMTNILGAYLAPDRLTSVLQGRPLARRPIAESPSSVASGGSINRELHDLFESLIADQT